MDTGKHVDITPELEPFFDFTLINCFPLCSYCEVEQEFESCATPYSDAWYLDMARAIRDAKWVIPKRQEAACPSCAAERGLAHLDGAKRRRNRDSRGSDRR